MVLHITTEISSLRWSLSGQSVPNALSSWMVIVTIKAECLSSGILRTAR